MISRTSLRLVLIGGLTAGLIFGGAPSPAISAAPGAAHASSAAASEDLDSDGDGVADRPDAMSASLAARRIGERVEDLSQRTPSTQVFANDDGTWTTETYAGPVRALDADGGEWAPIDTTLSESDGSWRPAAAVGGLRFSAGGDAPMAAMTDVDGKELTWSWPTRLPAPKVAGSTLTYRNVVPNGDLVVEALPDGFSHSVVLRAAPSGPLELPVVVGTDGAKLTESKDGTLAIATRDGDLVTAPQPTMWDTAVGSEGTPTTVPIDTHVTRQGDQTTLTLTPDSDFLTDPDTVYPVTIDPTFTTTTVGIATVDPAATYPTIDWGARVGFDGTTAYETMIAFDEADVRAGAVTSATLSMYAHSANNCNAMPIKVQRATAGWDPFGTALPVTTTAGETAQSQTAKGGPGSCSATGWDSWDITSIAQAWSAGADAYFLRVAAVNPTVANWRAYDSALDSNPRLPMITMTGNRTPAAPSAPLPSDSQIWAGQYQTRTATPAWSTSATDADLGTVRYTTEVHDSNAAGSPVLASCSTGYVQSGATESCTPTTPLADGTYYVRSAADDGTSTGPWSPWRQVTVNYDQPEPVVFSCPTAANGTWYATRPASSMSCTFTSATAVQLEWSLNGVAQPILTANASGAATKTGIAIPTAGWTELKVRGLSSSGLATSWKTYSFGTGNAWITAPAANAATASTLTYQAASAANATSAKLQYRLANSTTDPAAGWIDATAVRTADGSAWTGSVTGTTTMSSLPGVIWTPSAEPSISAPKSLETRVVFTFPSGTTTRATQILPVQLNAHDTVAGSPTATVGPGEVSLGSGEFQTGATEALAGSLAISRSHLSNAEPATGAAGVFGPGWSASVAPSGPASYVVTDQRGSTGTLLLTAPDGTAYTYQSSNPAASNLTGVFAPRGDAVALGATLSLDAATGVLTYTESSGERTTFEQVGGKWMPTATIGTAAASTTSYYYDASGLPSWIIAPPPPGATVTCTPTALPAGCQALHLNYLTLTGGAKRLESVDYRAWDPKLNDGDGDAGNDGLPDSNAAVSTVSVAKYEYNANGTLQASWDPRRGDGASALKATYEYATTGTKTRLTKLTPPGLKPWQISYDADGAVTTVTRPQDPNAGSGNATWTIRYGIALNAEGDGLPNLSSAKTAAWGQPAGDAPETGAAVFGPDRVPATTPTATDWKYAQLYYWNGQGRLTNTAGYGAAAWQIGTSKYDGYGNKTWSLSPAAKAKAISDGAGVAANSAAAADRYASQVLYNATGSRIEAQYGPTTAAMNEAGVSLQLRTLVQYVYDDEADASLVPGRPTTGVPAGGFGVVAEIRASASDEATAGTWAISQNTIPTPTSNHLYDTKLTRYRYDPAVTGDPSGWTMRQATQTRTQNGAGWDTAIERYDATGRVFQSRTPEGVATGQQTRYHNTVYYTADGSATRSECRNNVAWEGLVCWEGPQAQPTSGQEIPTTSYAGYSQSGVSTRVVTTSGTATKVMTAQLDQAGRMTRTATTTTGTSDQTVAATTTTYSATTGLPLTVSDGSMTLVTDYDTWGRTVSQTDGAGNTAVTTYDAAGQVRAVNDGKGTSTYSYGETFSDLGAEEHRGLPTSVDVGIAGAAPVRGVYTADGQLTGQYFPGSTTPVIDYRYYDLAGHLYNRGQYTPSPFQWAGNSSLLDVNGRVRRSLEATGNIDYTYDDRGRLTQVAQKLGGQCYTRAYALTADSNRTTLTNFNPTGTGACQTGTPGSVATSTYDAADRITNTGYAYDDLGRTTTVPAADTGLPASGNATTGYYANDMVATIAQGARSQTYTLDPLGRVSTTRNLTSGVSLVETTNHYVDGSDSPAWTETKSRPNASTAWTATWTRYVKGLDGGLAIIQSSTGTPQLPTYNTHGDVISSIPLGGTAWGAFTTYTEFGGTVAGGATPGRYGWLGEAQRDGQGVAGLTLMGVRLYNPVTGRFLTRDPIQGGNDNAYVYPADPINMSDLSGAYSSWISSVEKQIWYSSIFNFWNADHHWYNRSGYKYLVHLSRYGTGAIAGQHVWVDSLIGAVAGELLGFLGKKGNIVIGTLIGVVTSEIKNAASSAYKKGKTIRLTFYRYDWSPAPFYMKIWEE